MREWKRDCRTAAGMASPKSVTRQCLSSIFIVAPGRYILSDVYGNAATTRGQIRAIQFIRSIQHVFTKSCILAFVAYARGSDINHLASSGFPCAGSGCGYRPADITRDSCGSRKNRSSQEVECWGRRYSSHDRAHQTEGWN